MRWRRANRAGENYDLSATRDVKGANISAETVGTLGNAWTFPVTSPAAFDALTANPTIVGEAISIQEASANVYALDKETGEQLCAKKYSDMDPSGGPLIPSANTSDPAPEPVTQVIALKLGGTPQATPEATPAS